MIGIYKIENLINHRVYIGQSRNIKRRWYEHKRGLSKRKKYINIHLQRAWKKYGSENFKFEVLEECTVEQLNDKETYWLKFYQPNVYNIGPTNNKYTMSEELRKRLSEKRRFREYAKKLLRETGFYRKKK